MSLVTLTTLSESVDRYRALARETADAWAAYMDAIPGADRAAKARAYEEAATKRDAWAHIIVSDALES